EDYCRFRAFFEPLELRHERVAGEADPGPFKKYVYAQSYGPIKSGAIRIFDEKLDAQTFMFRGGDARNRIEGKPPVDCGPPRSLTSPDFAIRTVKLPPTAYYPGLKDFLRQEELDARQAEVTSSEKALLAAEQLASGALEKLVGLKAASSGPATASNQPAVGELLAAQRAADDARMAEQLSRAAHAVAVAKQQALQQRIAADDAGYLRGGGNATAEVPTAEVLEKSKVAHVAENQAAYLAAEHARLAAEQALILAERAVAEVSVGKADTAGKADKAAELKKAAAAELQKLTTARTASDAARAKLASNEATYSQLSPKYPTQSTGRRTALAQWLGSRTNPLTARIAINHMWLRHFGSPLVETVDNFGIQGKTPTHPELLDWLAVELMNQHWSMKAMHRLMVTSAAYRRSSYIAEQVTEQGNERVAEQGVGAQHPNIEVDRDNRTYWRFPTRRMEAEVVRDSVLACSGVLDSSLGGREIDVDQWIKSPRRSLYFTLHGESQMLFLSTFDGANVCDCYRRTSTVLPSQALALANSELLVHYGRVCAAKLSADLKHAAPSTTTSAEASTVPSAEAPGTDPVIDTATDSGSNDVAFVQLAFETLLGRPAGESELQASLTFLAEQTSSVQSATVDQTSESKPASTTQPTSTTKPAEPVSDVQPPSSDRHQRARENLIMALFNHNDFVSVR
ncbi:MAG: DUF1553 domain-containing protein, partial [Pirellulaceae bacterium]|nr:DUF1553 domain-containing protein [Pirellulaceae bacterium]